MAAAPFDQQPIAKVVGRRVPQPPGKPPSPEARSAWNAMAGYRTRVPRGVFVYRDHDEMARDRERWLADAMVQRPDSVAEYTRPATWEDVKRLAQLRDNEGG